MKRDKQSVRKHAQATRAKRRPQNNLRSWREMSHEQRLEIAGIIASKLREKE